MAKPPTKSKFGRIYYPIQTYQQPAPTHVLDTVLKPKVILVENGRRK
jgi:hypothetical protein